MSKAEQGGNVIRGEFLTDGRTFILTMNGVPISGVGASPQEAYDDLVRLHEKAGSLPDRLRELAREQDAGAERARLFRLVGAAVIGLTIVGGALGGAVALAPRVAEDIADTSIRKFDRWLAGLTPEARRRLSTIFHPPPESRSPPVPAETQ